MVHTDTKFLSVLSYAIENLKVPHVIVYGHYNCGAVRAALSHAHLGLIDNWVRNIKDTYFAHKFEIDKISHEPDRVNKLVEPNVIEQVKNLAHTSSFKKHGTIAEVLIFMVGCMISIMAS